MADKEFDSKFIEVARNEWMLDFLKAGEGKVRYMKQLSRAELEERIGKDKDSLDFIDRKTTGKEFVREFHLFEMDDGTPVIAQWRGTDGGVLPGDCKPKRKTKVEVKRTRK